MTSTPVLVNAEAPIGRITLNRPDANNGLTDEMLTLIEGAIKELDQTDGVRCIVLDAAGDSFCVGADIALVEEYSNDELRDFLRHATDTVRAIEKTSIPVVSAVSGHALGGGMELTLGSDITIAQEGSTFGVPEAKIGLLPAAGGTQRLPRVVGKKIASELLFTGRHLDVERAKSLGIVNTITENDPTKRAEELAEEIAQSGPLAVAACKRLVVEGSELPLEEALDQEQEEAYRLIDSEDSTEGIEAFLSGRDPEFQNR